MANTKVTGDLIAAGTITTSNIANGTITATNIASGGLDSILSTYLTTNTYATEGYVTTAVANLVDAAPATLDTLNELAAALGDDPNFATTVTNSLASKVDGTGTANYIPKLSDSNTITDSIIYESGGNIGIGTTSAGTKLVLGTTSDAENTITLKASTTGANKIFFSDGTGAALYAGFLEYTHSDNRLAFGTNSTERMRIDASGNVGIGTSSPQGRLTVMPNGGSLNNQFAGAGIVNFYSANSPFNVRTGTIMLESFSDHGIGVGPGISFSGRYINGSTTSWQFAKIVGRKAVPNSEQPAGVLSFATTTTGGDSIERMTIDYFGNIGAPSGSNIYNASDERLKQNVVPIDNGLDTVFNLNPVKFNWIEGFSDSEQGKDMLGFVAQEVQQVLPEAVEGFGGNSLTIGEQVIESPLRVNEKFIIPVLVKAIQELKQIIDNQQQQINDLTK